MLGSRSMTSAVSTKPKKINLRRPDVMKEVQAEVVTHYRSSLVEYIRANDNRVVVPGKMTIRLAKQFGFCYGVERAIDLAYAARKVFPDPHAYFYWEKSFIILK
jgi:4-hydroxy-3-methylbut-2-enyl diphosphate reductase